MHPSDAETMSKAIAEERSSAVDLQHHYVITYYQLQGFPDRGPDILAALKREIGEEKANEVFGRAHRDIDFERRCAQVKGQRGAMKPKPTPAEWLAKYERLLAQGRQDPDADIIAMWRLLGAARAILEDLANTHPPLRTER